mmetsp:Transcript_22634/g.63109  ORF Transcript_22634/g.63109 Transcript_22634/m.63109 type:complete len:349 (-) Transcript_22634:16-1062(-)
MRPARGDDVCELRPEALLQGGRGLIGHFADRQGPHLREGHGQHRQLRGAEFSEAHGQRLLGQGGRELGLPAMLLDAGYGVRDDAEALWRHRVPESRKLCDHAIEDARRESAEAEASVRVEHVGNRLEGASPRADAEACSDGLEEALVTDHKPGVCVSHDAQGVTIHTRRLLAAPLGQRVKDGRAAQLDLRVRVEHLRQVLHAEAVAVLGDVRGNKVAEQHAVGNHQSGVCVRDHRGLAYRALGELPSQLTCMGREQRGVADLEPGQRVRDHRQVPGVRLREEPEDAIRVEARDTVGVDGRARAGIEHPRRSLSFGSFASKRGPLEVGTPRAFVDTPPARESMESARHE